MRSEYARRQVRLVPTRLSDFQCGLLFADQGGAVPADAARFLAGISTFLAGVPTF
jgi:hypothetical protein